MRQFLFEPDAPTAASVPERADVAEQYRWNLADLYPSVEAWKAQKDAAAAEIQEVAAFKGRLTE